MIEIVFGQSASGSLKVAQGYGKGKYPGGAISVLINNTDGTNPTEEEMKVARIQAEEKERQDWEKTVNLASKREDVYCFDIALSIGDISDNGLGEQRRAVLENMLSFYYIEDVKYHVQETLKNIEKSLASVIERYVNGEEIRIWYSDNPDELCGMFWLMGQIHTLKSKTPIYIVKLPNWEYGEGKTVISRNGWGDVAPSEWGKYIPLQEEVHPIFISACAMKWSQLREENTPLRVMLNGQIQSVSEDIYDTFILREIAMQNNEFKMAVLIGNVLGKYQLGISDVLVAKRIETMIENGKLEVIKEALDGEPSYRKLLRKRGLK